MAHKCAGKKEQNYYSWTIGWLQAANKWRKIFHVSSSFQFEGAWCWSNLFYLFGELNVLVVRSVPFSFSTGEVETCAYIWQQEALFDPVSLTCSHMFCYMCACSAGSVSTIDGIKAADSKSKCPLCRKVGNFTFMWIHLVDVSNKRWTWLQNQENEPGC